MIDNNTNKTICKHQDLDKQAHTYRKTGNYTVNYCRLYNKLLQNIIILQDVASI